MSGSAFAVTHHAFSSGAGRTSDGNGSHASTLKSPSYTKSVSWQHYPAQENGTVAINNRIPLQSLTAANIMVEGSIIGYESNVKSGGVGARYFGIGADTQYQLDEIAVNLRVVNVSTGEILSSVNTSKTILSYEVQAGVFRFIDYQRLLEGEVGYTSNEPVMLCLMSAIETGVIFLINDGIDRGLWDLQNKAERQNDILVKYRHMSVPPES